MENIMQQLVKFVTETEFTDLPEAVVYETKRLLLDSIGCAVGGLSTDRGKICVELIRRLGGLPESTVIGLGDKVSCANAAFVNGELINAQDYDAHLVGHIIPNVIPAPLALAESTSASGKTLLLAIVLGLEVATRLVQAVSSYWKTVPESPDKPDVRKLVWPPVHGFSSTIFGAAAGAGNILKLNPEKMANALGIAGYICPPSTFRKWMHTTPVRMTKYDPPGWTGQGGVTAALLADMGYIGDTEVFDGEFGFWRFSGFQEWKPELIMDKLGTEWKCAQVSYKPYPCGRCMHGALDKFIQIIEENNLSPEDIEKVCVMPYPNVQFPAWKENKLRTDEDFEFNAPYVLSCAAYRIRITDIGDPDVKKDPRIRKFMEKVKVNIDSAYEREFVTLLLKDPVTKLAKVKVMAKGKTFEGRTAYLPGSWRPEEFRMKDEELVDKFKNNVSGVLPSPKVERAVETVYRLEKLENIAELMETVSI